jgi:hypothetical protein
MPHEDASPIYPVKSCRKWSLETLKDRPDDEYRLGWLNAGFDELCHVEPLKLKQTLHSLQ